MTEVGVSDADLPLEQAFNDPVRTLAERNFDFYDAVDGNVVKIAGGTAKKSTKAAATPEDDAQPPMTSSSMSTAEAAVSVAVQPPPSTLSPERIPWVGDVRQCQSPDSHGVAKSPIERYAADHMAMTIDAWRASAELRLSLRVQQYIKRDRPTETSSRVLFLSTRRHSRGKCDPLTSRGLQLIVRRLGQASGVHAHPHKFRHTFAMRSPLPRGST